MSDTMRIHQRTEGNPNRRKKSRLEVDDPHHCKWCGIELPIGAVSEGFEECPECYIEQEEKYVEYVFGSLNSVESVPQYSLTEFSDE